ncbi:MAG TPA: cysteine desulfurase family protein [Pseudobdellovibrionaceae bacterium]|nr:cysteine desulfurase family protein [Pseudobdellovibrionaceae bacterium]
MERIYLDYNATTPLDPRVFEAMKPYFTEHFGNPASGQHAWGWTAETALQRARAQTASFISAQPQEIYFTSGATEANNWALFGIFHQIQMSGNSEPFHLITTAVEHNSVLNATKALGELGAEIDILPVDSNGQVAPEEIERAIRPHTKLVSAIWVNNEIGTINRMKEIGDICRRKNVYFHSDGTQAVGKIPVDLSKMPIDLLSFSGHKMYGPKGVGALFIRNKDPHVSIKPFFFGGGHERGLRSGTPNVPGIVGLGAAAEICSQELAMDMEKALMLGNACGPD